MDSSSGPLYVATLFSNIRLSGLFDCSKTSPTPDVYDRPNGTYTRLTSAVGCPTTGAQSLECLRNLDFQVCSVLEHSPVTRHRPDPDTYEREQRHD